MKLHSLKTFCGLFCLAVIGFAHADEVIKTFPGGGAHDILNPPSGKGDEGLGAIKIHKKCRNNEGTLISEGERGYQKCLSDRLKRPTRGPDQP